MSGTMTVTITVLDLVPMRGANNLLALADVEVLVADIPLTIYGIQVRANAKQSSIHLPCYRAPDGKWKAAVGIPDEVRDAIASLIQDEAIERGILRRAETAA
jgi:stage V sporulation protein G